MGADSLEYVRERFEAEEEPIHTVSLGFPQILLELEEPMDVILKVWHSQKAEPPFERSVLTSFCVCIHMQNAIKSLLWILKIKRFCTG